MGKAGNGGLAYELIDGHLKNLDHLTVVGAREGPPFNPGSTEAYVEIKKGGHSGAKEFEACISACTSSL